MKRKLEARMPVEPRSNLLRLLGRVVVDDEMQLEVLGHDPVDLLEEANELFGAMTRQAFASHSAGSLEEVRRELDHVVDDYDLSNSPEAQQDLAQVNNLSNNSLDPAFFQATEQLSVFLRDKKYIADALNRSRFPPGAVINRRTPIYQPFLKYGAELARLFENETPGLWHRQVLNVLLDPTIPGGFGQRLSPPRQALIWAVLDVAISSALQAAWYFKWFELSGSRISFRECPWEVDKG